MGTCNITKLRSKQRIRICIHGDHLYKFNPFGLCKVKELLLKVCMLL